MQAAEKLSITLLPERANCIRQKVSSNLYGSNSEIIREALHGRIDRKRRFARLNAVISLGGADAEAVRVKDIDEMPTELLNA
jgi:antitoxin ParD1/3/4